MLSSVYLHINADTAVKVHTNETADVGPGWPFIVLSGEKTSLALVPANSASPAEVLAFARRLADGTGRFLAAAEAYAGNTRTPLDQL
ncbi:hypothetical protein [Kitasatospora sp. NPDC056181]|uniref:hypothetical protein n=1 Tax=Kitasatospora sp. NPDC056181 TaxID=3345737 RepID=UPI0035E27EE2